MKRGAEMETREMRECEKMSREWTSEESARWDDKEKTNKKSGAEL